jgi:hypothetical protein
MLLGMALNFGVMDLCPGGGFLSGMNRIQLSVLRFGRN